MTLRPILAALWAAVLAGPAWTEAVAPDDLSFDGIDVAFLGEVHDNPDHHLNQALWVARMEPAALVFEMLTPDQALRVGPDRADAQALGRLLEWEARGWPDFDMYHPIFLAAPEAPVFGAEMPRARVRDAVDGGAAAVMGEAAPIFGLDRPLDDAQQARREAEQARAHCDALPEDLLPGMVEAQRLRDAAIARAVIAALAETGGLVAVITGNGHARRDHGAPAALDRAQPGLDILTVGQFESPPDGDAPYDAWTTAPAPERDDPCKGLRDD